VNAAIQQYAATTYVNELLVQNARHTMSTESQDVSPAGMFMRKHSLWQHNTIIADTANVPHKHHLLINYTHYYYYYLLLLFLFITKYLKHSINQISKIIHVDKFK